MAVDPHLWRALPAPTRDVLWKAAQLAEAPIPALVACSTREGMDALLAPALEAGLATATPHEPWGRALWLAPQLRAAIRAGAFPVGGHQLELQLELVSTFTSYYYSFFVAPVERAVVSAQQLEPHLDVVTELAQRLELHEEVAQLLHRRALFVSWFGEDEDRALAFARDSVVAYRKAHGGRPHPGMLAKLLTLHADLLLRQGRPDRARELLLEAEDLALSQVGGGSMEAFLLYCQLAAASRASGDEAGARDAEDEAREIAARLARDGAHREHLLGELEDPLSWARWDAIAYEGL